MLGVCVVNIPLMVLGGLRGRLIALGYLPAWGRGNRQAGGDSRAGFSLLTGRITRANE
jgi:hypothetical protein